MTSHYEILGVRISRVNPQSAVEKIGQWIQSRGKAYVCVAPVSTIMDCQDDPQYRAVVNGAGMVTPDGMPVVWLGRRQGCAEVRRTYGPELMLNVCAAGLAQGWRHYIYGGTPENNQKLLAALNEKCPGIKIVGSWAPGILKTGQRETPETMRTINAAGPDILWVGLGSPKQDFWMSLHRDQLDVPVIVGVGAAFDFIAGTKPQAPRWMRSAGLEWLFRLCCEPGRLWKRYLLGNTRFIWLITAGGIKKMF